MTPFPRMDPADLEEAEAHQLFQDVEDHYHGCVGGFLGDVEDQDVPREVRVVCRLWFFLAEIGGGGVRDYLWNHCSKLRTLQQIHADLMTVEAHELRVLLEAGIKFTYVGNSGEFLEDPGAPEWAREFQNTTGVESDDLDALSEAAAYPEGSVIVANYIRRNVEKF